FQAEDGIRYKLVTGVQTCALPIYRFLNFLGESNSHVRRDKSGSHGIHRDIAAGQFPRERLSETNQAGLARPVIGLARVSDHSDRSEERRVGKECNPWVCT